MRTWFFPTVHALAPVATLLFATACADASPAALSAAEQSLDPAQGAGPQGQPPRPPTCSKQEDCAGKCPPGSLGCTCAPAPDGNKVCAPTCSADADCPTVPGGELKCREGLCTPPPPPPRPAACSSSSDCTGKCPAGSRGCTCTRGPGDQKICAPSCNADSDCPAGDGPKLTCREGACVPPGPPPPPRACTASTDCDNACPPGSAQCVCHSSGIGSVCVTACASDSDCPVPPGANPVSCEQGVCAPPVPPPAW
jgi:hypothetical protein